MGNYAPLSLFAFWCWPYFWAVAIAATPLVLRWWIAPLLPAIDRTIPRGLERLGRGVLKGPNLKKHWHL